MASDDLWKRELNRSLDAFEGVITESLEKIDQHLSAADIPFDDEFRQILQDRLNSR